MKTDSQFYVHSVDRMPPKTYENLAGWAGDLLYYAQRIKDSIDKKRACDLYSTLAHISSAEYDLRLFVAGPNATNWSHSVM